MTSAAVGIGIVGAGVAVSGHLTDYPVLSAQAIRYALGAALLYLVAASSGRREPRIATTAWVRLVALALTGMVLFNVAVVRAVTTGEPAVVGTIVGLAPMGVALLVPMLERRRPRAAILAGATLAAGGAAIVEGFGEADVTALCWSVVALGCEVAFTVLAAPLLRTLSPIGLAIRACTLAALALLTAATLLDGGDALTRPDIGEALAIGYLAAASTAIAFVLWYRALAHLGPERTGLFVGLMPISAALVGAAITTAPLRAGTLIGTILTGAGLAIGLGSRRSRRPSTRLRAPSPGPTSGSPPPQAPMGGAGDAATSSDARSQPASSAVAS
jgi:drug/metabolite transporter (DMT)-like permease